MNRNIIVPVGPRNISDTATDADCERVAAHLARQGWRVSLFDGNYCGQGGSEEDWMEAGSAVDAACEELGIPRYDKKLWKNRTTED